MVEVIQDTLYSCLYPPLRFCDECVRESCGVNPQQGAWNNALKGETSPLRVAFVLQTLLCLLRLYNNKSGNVGSIAVLRSILDVGLGRWSEW